MRVLVIGSGGREHALCWKLKQDSRIEEVFCAPGNGGIRQHATCVEIDMSDFDSLVQFVENNRIDYTVVGPEQPLSDGIVDYFVERGLPIFGPNRRAAQIESSKSFAKDMMAKYGIPTASYKTFTDFERARNYVREMGAPIVVKADGLAAGKGVVVAETVEQAEAALHNIMIDRTLNDAGREVVIEECLRGEELSLMAFVSGRTVLPMVVSQDHKQVFDGDKGPNTGGMGAYSPVPQIPQTIVIRAIEEILQPMANAMEEEGLDFRGILYAGLMVTDDGPKVIEFNARFGDPETQVVLPRLKSDLLPVLQATSEGTLHQMTLEWADEAAICVVLASGGYPGSYEKGHRISGLSNVAEDALTFHAGTRLEDDQYFTNGGRVLGLTVLGDTLSDAQRRLYEQIKHVHFSQMHYRRDIGDKALRKAREQQNLVR